RTRAKAEARAPTGSSDMPTLQRPLLSRAQVLRRMRQTHESGARMRMLKWHKAPPCASERSSDVVGRTPRSAADALVGLPALRKTLRDEGVPRGPGGPPHLVRALLLLACVPLFAQITGTVTNQTTGKPQAGATVALYKVATRTGPELVDQAKSDAEGKFTINQSAQGPGPALIRTAFDGVTYNHMLPPGSPTTGLAIEVYNASKQPGAAKVEKHMILLEPSAGQLAVSETFLFKNEGKTAWNDPDAGTLKFFLPAGAGKPEAKATAPGGMPLGAPIVKTAKPDVFAVDFAIKPGDTRVDVAYTVPYTEGADLA